MRIAGGLALGTALMGSSSRPGLRPTGKLRDPRRRSAPARAQTPGPSHPRLPCRNPFALAPLPCAALHSLFRALPSRRRLQCVRACIVLARCHFAFASLSYRCVPLSETAEAERDPSPVLRVVTSEPGRPQGITTTERGKGGSQQQPPFLESTRTLDSPPLSFSPRLFRLSCSYIRFFFLVIPRSTPASERHPLHTVANRRDGSKITPLHLRSRF